LFKCIRPIMMTATVSNYNGEVHADQVLMCLRDGLRANSDVRKFFSAKLLLLQMLNFSCNLFTVYDKPTCIIR